MISERALMTLESPNTPANPVRSDTHIAGSGEHIPD
jgi:hypothetical protein